MDCKTVSFDDGYQRLINIAEEKFEKGDFEGALSFFFRAFDKKQTLSAVEGIADMYAELELYEQSDYWWFYYLSKCPKEKESIAYEELMMNFFLSEKYIATGYYLNKKNMSDEEFNRSPFSENVETVMDFFSKQLDAGKAYRVVYPYEEADFSMEFDFANQAFEEGDLDSAIKFFKKIPKGSPQFTEASEKLAVTEFLSGNTEEGIRLYRQYMEDSGETVANLCNVSGMYGFIGDNDKAEYYYRKALSLKTGDKDEYFKIATCAVERCDHQTAAEYFEKFFDGENVCELTMRHFFGIALLNCGRYSEAKEQFFHLCRLDPMNVYYPYYSDLALSLEQGKKSLGEPLKYVTGLPESEIKSRKKRIKDFSEKFYENENVGFLRKGIKDLLIWGLYSDDKTVSGTCASMLAWKDDAFSENIINRRLLDPAVPDGVKVRILFLYCLTGKAATVCFSHFFKFVKVKIPKVKLPDIEGAALLNEAFSLAFAKTAVIGEGGADKLKSFSEKVFVKFRKQQEITVADLNVNELAAFLTWKSGIKIFKDVDAVANYFGVKTADVKSLGERLGI